MNIKQILIGFLIFFVILIQIAGLYLTYVIAEPIRTYNENREIPEMRIEYCPYCGSELTK